MSYNNPRIVDPRLSSAKSQRDPSDSQRLNKLEKEIAPFKRMEVQGAKGGRVLATPRNVNLPIN